MKWIQRDGKNGMKWSQFEPKSNEQILISLRD